MTRRSPRPSRGPARIEGVSIAEFMLRGASGSTGQRRRDRRRIVVSDGIWRGYDVAVEPPMMAFPLRHFGTAAEAQAYADALVASEGWEILDRTGGQSS